MNQRLLDDVLDVTGPPERTGKARGTDLLDGTVTLPLILLGGINRIDTIDNALHEGFEFVAMGRALLRDPYLVDKFRNHTADEGLCIHCNKCMPTIYRGTHCVLVEPDKRPVSAVADHTEFRDVVKVDVDASPQTAMRYGIMSIPTVAFFAPGQPPRAAVGFRPLEALEAAFGLQNGANPSA